jgi:hypothetical protein
VDVSKEHDGKKTIFQLTQPHADQAYAQNSSNAAWKQPNTSEKRYLSHPKQTKHLLCLRPLLEPIPYLARDSIKKNRKEFPEKQGKSLPQMLTPDPLQAVVKTGHKKFDESGDVLLETILPNLVPCMCPAKGSCERSALATASLC